MKGAPLTAHPRRPHPEELATATISEADGVRFLHLGTPWVQGAMRLAKPLAIELEYVQRMMTWMLLRPADRLEGAAAGTAVQLGLGAGAVTRFCLSKLRMRSIAVELNPSVVDACRMWFRLPAESARFQVLTMDAADFVADPTRAESIDTLAVDLYDHQAASPVLDSAAFYADCHRSLNDGGTLAVNLFGRDASFARSAGRIAAAFGADRVRHLRPTREGNTIVIALKNAPWPERPALAERAETIERRFGLPARKWLRMLRPLDLAGDVGTDVESATAPELPAR